MQEILDKLIEWGKQHSLVESLILTGSYAQNAKVDFFSDLDLSVFSDSIDSFMEQHDWVAEIEDVWLDITINLEDQYPTQTIIFEEGRKVDFTFQPVTELKLLTNGNSLPDLYKRGYIVLVDKTGLTSQMQDISIEFPIKEKPTQEEFVSIVKKFWLEVYYVAKYLYRNDLWHAKFRDWTTKEYLLQMIEWYELSKHKWSYDVKYLGVRMEDWVSPDIWKKLHECFAHFDREDSLDALANTMDLFEDISTRAAKNLKFKYPEKVGEYIKNFVTPILKKEALK